MLLNKDENIQIFFTRVMMSFDTLIVLLNELTITWRITSIDNSIKFFWIVITIALVYVFLKQMNKEIRSKN